MIFMKNIPLASAQASLNNIYDLAREMKENPDMFNESRIRDYAVRIMLAVAVIRKDLNIK
ncbi:MAG: hypothetical protein ABH824_06985 [Nanoarchaeota archaeon]